MSLSQPLFEGDDFGRDLSRAFVVQHKPDHEIAECEVEGKDAFPTDSSNHGIHLDPVVDAVQITVGNEVLIASADFQSFGNIWRILLFSGLELDCSGQIDSRNGKIPFVDISVNAGLGYAQIVCLQDMIQVLAFLDAI